MNKKIISILLIILIILIGAIILSQSTDFYSNDEFIVTESNTVISVPNGVKLINSNNNGIEIYGNDIAEFIIINNNDTNLINTLENSFTSGEKVSDGVYRINSQYIGNNFNIWTGENLAVKEDTVYTTYAKNSNASEYIFCISKSQSICDVDKWNVDWGN